MRTEPQNATLRRRLVAGALIAAALAALTIAFTFDGPMARWIAAHSSKSLRHSMALISRVGDWPAHVALGILIGAVAWLRGNKRWLRIALAMLLSCALAGGAARVIKITAARPRPAAMEQVRGWHGPKFAASHNSFPSGHTACSMALFAALAIGEPHVGVPLLVIPLLIGASRLFAGAHYLSDVVFAAMLGAICAVLVGWAIRKITKSQVADRKLK